MIKKITSNSQPDAQELAQWLRALRLYQEGTAPEPNTIPGFDSYSPSYLSGGAVADDRNGRGTYGELEQYSK
jgi:hypothetical protein